MKISNNNSPNFGTKICFVSLGELNKLSVPLRDLKFVSYSSQPDLMRGAASSYGVKTSVSGVLDFGRNFSLLRIRNLLKDFRENQFVPSRIKSAVLIGAAEPKSAEKPPSVYTRIQEYLTQSGKKVSTFKHKADTSSDLIYIHPQDTLYVCTRRKGLFGVKEVKDVKGLQKALTDIAVAPNDSLHIGGVEISPAKHPELFIQK